MEPTQQKSTEPIDDKYTEIMQKAFDNAVSGTANYSSIDKEERFTEGSGYRGIHRCSCGETSGNKDYLLENGMIKHDF